MRILFGCATLIVNDIVVDAESWFRVRRVGPEDEEQVTSGGHDVVGLPGAAQLGQQDRLLVLAVVYGQRIVATRRLRLEREVSEPKPDRLEQKCGCHGDNLFDGSRRQ